MLDFLLLLIFIFSIFMGLKRGLILQVLHLTGFIIAFIVAVIYYRPFGEVLDLWVPYPQLPSEGQWADFLAALPLEITFYNAVAFVIIFIAVKIILQIIASMLDFVASIPIISSVNKILGGLLGFVEVYFISFILLYLLALTPIPTIQDLVNHSAIALFILEHTPYFSDKIIELWAEYTTNQ